jgi:hypothetical protein
VTKDEALKLALDDLIAEYHMETSSFAKRVDEIFKQALSAPVQKGAIGAAYQKSPWDEKGISMPPPAAPVQEPVAWLQVGLAPFHDGDVIARTSKPKAWNPEWWRFEPLYTTPPAQPAPVQETKKSIVEALEAVAAYFYDGPVRNTSVVAACEKALNDIAGKEIYESWTPKDQAKLEDIEQYRMQMAGISTAAIGYWKEGDSIDPDYDTTALRDVAKLYARYAALYTTPPAAQRQWVGLTDEERLTEAARHFGEMHIENCGLGDIKDFARALEAKIKEKNT